MTRARFSLIWLGVLATCWLGLTGCTQYQWGTTGHLVFSTLYVKGVRNTTLAPQMSAVISNILRDDFNHDGRIQLVNSPKTRTPAWKSPLLAIAAPWPPCASKIRA